MFDPEYHLIDGRRIDGGGLQENDIKLNGGSVQDLAKFIDLAKQSADVVDNISTVPLNFQGKPRMMNSATSADPLKGGLCILCFQVFKTSCQSSPQIY